MKEVDWFAAVPDWYVELFNGNVSWLNVAYWNLRFAKWPGEININEAFKTTRWPISLHEAIAIATVNVYIEYHIPQSTKG